MQGRSSQQSEQELAFAQVYATTGDHLYAAAQAGYTQPRVAAHRLLARPIVQAEIKRQQTERLYSQVLPVAIEVLHKILADDTENSRNRIAAAKIVLDRTLGAADAAADAKEPHEMTADELAARIARLRQRQAEMANAARDVTPQIEPDTPDEGGVFG